MSNPSSSVGPRPTGPVVLNTGYEPAEPSVPASGVTDAFAMIRNVAGSETK
jgi:hypothetical protein